MTDNTDNGRESSTEVSTDEDRSITVNRVIEASPERVYDALVDPTFRMSFTADIEELEPYAHTFHGTYEELSPGEWIVYTEEFESDNPGMAGEMTTTVTFKTVPNGTEVTARQAGIPENIPPQDANEGWNDSLGNLAELIKEPYA